MSYLADDLGESIDSDLPLLDLSARYEIHGEPGQAGLCPLLPAPDRPLT